MATTVNDRDLFIMSGTRTEPVTLPSDVGVSGNVVGSLNGIPVQQVIDAAYASGGGDETEAILSNSATSIVMSASNLFKTGTGSGGVFIGAGGIIGKNSAGVTKITINASTGLLTAEDAVIKGTLTAGSVITNSVTVDGVTIGKIRTDAVDAHDGTENYRQDLAPTNAPSPSGITVTNNDDGSRDIELSWTYTQGALPADGFVIFYKTGSGTVFTLDPNVVLASTAIRYRFQGAAQSVAYRAGIAAYRRTESGIKLTAIQQPTASPDWRVAAGTTNYTGQLNGTNTSTVINNATNGNTAATDTADFRTLGAPSNSPSIGSISTVQNANGTLDITLNWTYTQGTRKADYFILYYNASTTNPTTSSSVLMEADGNSRSVRIPGVAMDRNYRVGITAARISAAGVEQTAIVNSWARNAQTSNVTSNLDGTAASTVVTNAATGASHASATGNVHSVALSQISGDLGDIANGAGFVKTTANQATGGGRAFSALDSSNDYVRSLVSTKLTVVGSNPSTGWVGDSNGIRLYQSGTLRINLPVSGSPSFSGDITGGSNIDITGSARFNGQTTIGSSSYTMSVNQNLISGRSGARVYGGGAGTIALNVTNSGAGAGVQISTGSGTAISIANFSGGSGIVISTSGTALNVNSGVATFGSNVTISGTTTINAMTKIGTGLVTNLNAAILGNVSSDGWARIFPTNSGTANAAGAGISISVQGSLNGSVQTRGTSNSVIIENISDIRLKENIADEELGLDFVMGMKPRTFDMKSSPGIKRHGFIAQELQDIISDDSDGLVLENGDEDKTLGVDYNGMAAILVKAIQDLNNRIDNL